MPKKETEHRGIAVFGAPGTGKTTVAKHLAKFFPSGKYIEVFDYVIRPAMIAKERLPKNEKSFIQTSTKRYRAKSNKKFDREESRDFFTYLKKKYSSAVIAKTLIYTHKNKFPKKFMIIAGIRGHKNAVLLKQNGYLVIYLKAHRKHLTKRLSRRESFSAKAVEKENKIEERLFSTNKVEKIAHISFDTGITNPNSIVAQVRSMVVPSECSRCANSSINPFVVIEKSELCDVCEKYEKHFDKSLLKKELKFFLSLRGTGTGKYDAMAGISGGKDSTATLYEAKKLGFNPLAFSFDTGYYPKHIFRRAKEMAKKLATEYEHIDIRKYIRPVDRISFAKTADLYGEKTSEELKERFKKWYKEGRRHYSIKCTHKIPFVRTCQLCRRVVVRAYYAEAIKHGVRVIILGINEWAGLSQDSGSQRFVFSAIRKLQPFKNKPAVYVVHLPFLLQRSIKDTRKTLKKLGWTIPKGEALVETNANSCLFALAAESKAREMLGFHPDTSRLSREVTVGFITKAQAQKALSKVHNYNLSVRQVLKRAKVI